MAVTTTCARGIVIVRDDLKIVTRGDDLRTSLGVTIYLTISSTIILYLLMGSKEPIRRVNRPHLRSEITLRAHARVFGTRYSLRSYAPLRGSLTPQSPSLIAVALTKQGASSE